MTEFPVSNEFEDEKKIPSPALLVFPDIVKGNIAKAIEIAGDSKRLRPHVKTHKMPQVVQMNLELGIDKFKCSTLAELIMAAGAGADDILLAYPLAGPAIDNFFKLKMRFINKNLSVLVDNLQSAKLLEEKAGSNQTVLTVYIDLDNGMGRTGIRPGEEAIKLYEYIEKSDHLTPAGLHVYDGHLKISDPDERQLMCDRDFAGVLELRDNLNSAGHKVNELICGGSPTFPIHAKYDDRILSPGTYALWDIAYGNAFNDMDFSYAAWLLTRVISKPGENKLCLDLGHKAVAPEMDHPRVAFAELDEFEVIVQSEEHLVIETKRAHDFEIGDILHGVPRHICPTVALHDQCYIIENDKLTAAWPVIARNRSVGNYE